MKTQALASALRITISATELDMLISMAKGGADHGTKGDDLVHDLESGLRELRAKQSEKRFKQNERVRAEAMQRDYSHHASIGEYNIMALRSDWADVSEYPDYSVWADMHNPNTVLRDQGEIRRNVWKVTVMNGRVADDTARYFLSRCTHSADRNEIDQVAREIIAAGAL